MIKKSNISQAFQAAYPIVLGYIAIGIPCGILSDSIGFNALQVFLLSALFYSGAGQFMIPNMYLAGNPLASIILSVSMVNTRQMLYSASLSQYCQDASKRLAFLFSATVTDESFGVNITKFEQGSWDVKKATLVNLMSQTSWALSNVVGVIIGNLIGVPLAIASFAMTAIFICLASTQKMTIEKLVAIVMAMVGVFVCKLLGFGGVAILGGAIIGVISAVVCFKVRLRRISPTFNMDMAEKGAISDRAAFSAQHTSMDMAEKGAISDRAVFSAKKGDDDVVD